MHKFDRALDLPNTKCGTQICNIKIHFLKSYFLLWTKLKMCFSFIWVPLFLHLNSLAAFFSVNYQAQNILSQTSNELVVYWNVHKFGVHSNHLVFRINGQMPCSVTPVRWMCRCRQRRAAGGWALCRWPPAQQGISPLACWGEDTLVPCEKSCSGTTNEEKR